MFRTKEGVERRKGVTVCMISMMYQMKTSAKAFVTHCTIAVWAMNGMVAVKLIQLQFHNASKVIETIFRACVMQRVI